MLAREQLRSTFEALERKSEAVAAFNAAGASKNADTVKA
jgi:hypothetical protein